MKVIQVIDQLQVGGAERVLVDLSNLLKEQNCDVAVLCLLNEAKLDGHLDNDIPVIYLLRKHKFNPLYLIRLYKILISYDVIHIHLRQVLRYVSLLFYFSGLHNKKVILFHDHYGNIVHDTSISASIKSAIKRCAAYIGVSDQLVNWAKQNKLNTTIIKKSNIIRKHAAETTITKLQPDIVKVVSIGNFRPQKNYEFLLDLVMKSPDDYRFTIYGQPIDTVYYKKILETIRSLNLGSKIQLVTDCDNVGAYLGQYNLGLHTASSETGPLVAIEYLGANLPYLSFDTGEVANTLKHEFPYLIQNNFEVGAWLESMDFILSKSEELKDKLELFYEKNYSDEAYGKSFVKLYDELLNSH